MIELKFKKLDERAKIPTKEHEGDVGIDVMAIDCEYDVSKDCYVYHTGLACMTEGDVIKTMYCFPKSRNWKTDAYLTNGVGIVDSNTYRGEIQARYKNRTSLETMVMQETMKRLIKRLYNTGSAEYNPSLFDEEYIAVKEEFIERVKNLEFAPYKPGEDIFQIVMMEVPPVEISVVEELNETDRGSKGFGDVHTC